MAKRTKRIPLPTSAPSINREDVFIDIVRICYYATGHNAAFEPEYGLHVLNNIRQKLGLGILDESAMKMRLS